MYLLVPDTKFCVSIGGAASPKSSKFHLPSLSKAIEKYLSNAELNRLVISFIGYDTNVAPQIANISDTQSWSVA